MVDRQVAEGDEQQEGSAGQLVEQPGQELQGGRPGQVQVVEEQQQGLAVRAAAQQPVGSVEEAQPVGQAAVREGGRKIRPLVAQLGDQDGELAESRVQPEPGPAQPVHP